MIGFQAEPLWTIVLERSYKGPNRLENHGILLLTEVSISPDISL